MYFVTTNRKGYVMFCMTPSERAAVGLTEKQMVHFLIKEEGNWKVVKEWEASKCSHTDFMASLHRVEEPDDPMQLLRSLPA